MSWQNTYPLRDDQLGFTDRRPPQLPETRGKWAYAQIPDYFRQEVIRCIAIKSPTLNYFKNTHKKNWHTKVERWPKGFRVLTDYGEGVYQVRDPRLNMKNLSGQSSRYDYYDVFGNRATPMDEFDLEQPRWRSVAWYPGIMAFRAQFKQFDRLYIGSSEFDDYVTRVVEEEIKGKSQALNIRLWEAGLNSYVLDYIPNFDTTIATPMAWGSLPVYLNTIAWKRVTDGSDVVLTPITRSDLDALDTALGQNLNDTQYNTSVRDVLNSFSFLYYNRDGQAVTTTSANMRQQTIATVNRGIEAPTAPGSHQWFSSTTDSYVRKRNMIYPGAHGDPPVRNIWWMIPSEFTIWARGSQKVEMPQVIYPVAYDSSGNPVYPRFNITTGQWQNNAAFPFSPADLERLYYAVYYNYGQNMPKVGFCRPEVVIRMNQLAMISRTFEQSRRSFGPADFGIDAVFRDVALTTDLAVPERTFYLTTPDEIHFAFLEDDFQMSERPTNDFIDTIDGWTGYKVMVSDMRRHGIYWGFQV